MEKINFIRNVNVLASSGRIITLNIMLLILLLAGSPSAFCQERPRYNVLFIPIDDLNDRVSFFGWPEVVTPNLQRLVNRGMLFTKAYVQYPLCNPSRASFLSGWRPDHTRVFGNSTRPRSVIGSSVTFLPEYFKKFGYRIERYGKVMHGTFENDIAWDYAEPPEQASGSLTIRGITDTDELSGATAVEEVPGAWWVKSGADSTTNDGISATDLLKKLQQPQTQPFFYALGLISPHNNFTPTLKDWNLNGDPSVQELLPVDASGNTKAGFKGNGSSNIVIPNEPANDRDDIPSMAFNAAGQLIKSPDELKRTIHAYDGDVALMDGQLGRVLDELDRQNLWSNTIVVFFGDHGQHLGEHQGLWNKLTLFEESLHIPLIVCVPGKPAGVCNRVVELIDVYPTLIELCGLPPVPGTEASSFARLLDNPGQPWKKAVFSQVRRATVMGRSVTTERYRYNSWGGTVGELYDHNNDPQEYINQINNPAYAAVVADMKKILTDGWTKSLPSSVDTLTYYKDNDHDGYGSTADSIRSWYQPIGYALNKKDCDDANAALNPGADEICDGLDNNCDGIVDNSTFRMYFRDADGDGFGDRAKFVQSCIQPAGYVTSNTDCNDNNTSVNPAAIEVCNGIDDDCDGNVDETTLSAVSVAGTISCSGGTTTVNVTGTGGSGIYTGTGIFTVSAGNYSFTVSDSYGCSATTSGNIANGSGLPPATPASISGSLYNLCGGGDFTYSVPNVAGVTSYTWNVSSPFSVVQNNGRTAVINVPSSFTTGTISVKANNACGSSALRSVTVYAVGPNPSAAINGPSSVSANEDNIIYQVLNSAGASYNWDVPSGSAITSGQGTYKITVRFGAVSGNITLVVSNNCGSTPMGKKFVTIKSGFASAKESLVASQEKRGLRLYPNPAKALVNIVFHSKTSATKYDLVITDMSGKAVHTKPGIITRGENIIQVNTSSFASAMYLVKLITGDSVQMIKMYKEK